MVRLLIAGPTKHRWVTFMALFLTISDMYLVTMSSQIVIGVWWFFILIIVSSYTGIGL